MLNFTIPVAKKNYLRSSFLWDTLHEWNSLDLSIRSASSLNQFKTMYKSYTFHKKIILYDAIQSRSSVHHARMRMGLSALNSQRKSYNFIDHEFCPFCGLSPEDPLHFFIICPYLTTHRNVLMRDLTDIFTDKLPNIDLTSTSPRTRKQIVAILLYGSNDLTLEYNLPIFQAVNQFIHSSTRFD